MKRTKLVLGLFSLFLCFAIISCDKKQTPEKKDNRFSTKKVELTDDKPQYLLTDMTISGLRVNDTVNNIKASIFCPVVKSKQSGISTKSINETANYYFKNFVNQAKEKGKVENEFHSIVIRTVFVNSKNNIISSLLESKSCLVGEEETKFAFAVNFKKDSDKVLKFSEVFPIDETTFTEVRESFGKDAGSLSLKDFDNAQFAIDRDSILVFVSKENNTQTKLSAPISVMEAFMINVK